MAYVTMKKLISNENAKYSAGIVSDSDYEIWKTGTMNKLDVFFASGRLNEAQYEELVGLFVI